MTVHCFKVFDNESCPASGSIETKTIVLEGATRPKEYDSHFEMPTAGLFSIQPIVGAGTFTLEAFWSDDGGDNWDSGTTIVSGIGPSNDSECYSLNPDGPHSCLKIKATETGGTGSPSLTLNLCAD